MKNLTSYLKESMAELKKVTWPTQTQTRNYTFLVLGISLVMAAFLGALDAVFNIGLKAILTRGL